MLKVFAAVATLGAMTLANPVLAQTTPSAQALSPAKAAKSGKAKRPFTPKKAGGFQLGTPGIVLGAVATTGLVYAVASKGSSR